MNRKWLFGAVVCLAIAIGCVVFAALNLDNGLIVAINVVGATLWANNAAMCFELA